MPPSATPGATPRSSTLTSVSICSSALDSGEIQVEDFLAQVVPLDVADQDGLRRAAQVEVGEVAGRLDHPPDVVAGEGDRHHGLLVPVDHRRNLAFRRQRRDTRVPVPLFFAGSRGSTRILRPRAIGSFALTDPASRRGLHVMVIRNSTRRFTLTHMHDPVRLHADAEKRRGNAAKSKRRSRIAGPRSQTL